MLVGDGYAQSMHEKSDLGGYVFLVVYIYISLVGISGKLLYEGASLYLVFKPCSSWFHFYEFSANFGDILIVYLF